MHLDCKIRNQLTTIFAIEYKLPITIYITTGIKCIYVMVCKLMENIMTVLKKSVVFVLTLLMSQNVFAGTVYRKAMLDGDNLKEGIHKTTKTIVETYEGELKSAGAVHINISAPSNLHMSLDPMELTPCGVNKGNKKINFVTVRKIADCINNGRLDLLGQLNNAQLNFNKNPNVTSEQIEVKKRNFFENEASVSQRSNLAFKNFYENMCVLSSDIPNSEFLVSSINVYYKDSDNPKSGNLSNALKVRAYVAMDLNIAQSNTNEILYKALEKIGGVEPTSHITVASFDFDKNQPESNWEDFSECMNKIRKELSDNFMNPLFTLRFREIIVEGEKFSKKFVFNQNTKSYEGFIKHNLEKSWLTEEYKKILYPDVFKNYASTAFGAISCTA